MIALLLTFTVAGNQALHAGRAAVLRTLPCDSGTVCDAHWVADDWSGSGNWSDRVSSITATLHGTLSKTTSQFTGRSYISGFTTSNYFDLVATSDNTMGSTTQRSFELLMYEGDVSGSGIGNCIGYYNANGPNDAGNMGLFASGSQGLRAIVFNDNDSFRFDFTTSGAVATKYSLYTVVFNDAADGKIRIYRNGALLTAQAGTGTLATPSNQPWGLGVIRQGTGVYGAATNGRLIEALRHQSALSASSVAARVGQFAVLRQ